MVDTPGAANDGARQALDLAIETHQRVAAQQPPGSEPWIRETVQLAVALARRDELAPSLDDVNRAVAAWREMIPLIGMGRGQFEANLAAMLVRRHERAEDLPDLDEAVDLFGTSAEEPSIDPTTRANRLAALADALGRRFVERPELSDIDGAIAAAKSAAALPVAQAVTDARSAQAGALHRYKARFTRKRKDADAAVEFLFALERSATAERAGDWANDLRAAMEDRMEILGPGPEADADMESAIDAGRRAVAPSAGPRDRGPRLLMLGSLLHRRFASRGRLDDLTEAIDLTRSGIANLEGDQMRAEALAFLAERLFDRYSIFGMRWAADLAEGKTSIERAIALGRTGPRLSDWLLTHVSYREALSRVSPVLPAEDDFVLEELERAINCAQEGWPREPEALARKAIVLARRSRRLDRPADLDSAIELGEDALALAQERGQRLAGLQEALADMLRRRHGRTNAPHDRDRAVDLYRGASSEQANPSTLSTLRASSAWASWAFAREAWNEAAEAFEIATRTSDRLYRAQLARESREFALAGAATMWTASAYALAKLGRFSEASQRLERGRARLLADALELGRADLTALREGHPDLAGRYLAAAQAWRALATRTSPPLAGPIRIELRFGTGDIERLLAGEAPAGRSRSEGSPEYLAGRTPSAALDIREQLEAAREELDAVIDQIHALPDHQHFLAAVSNDDIKRAAASKPLVYLAPTSKGGLGLILGPGESCAPVWLPGLTTDALEAAVDGYRVAQTDRLDDLTRWLWHAAVGPVVQELESRGHGAAVLVPGGLLGALPLAAAWTASPRQQDGRTYAIDRIKLTVVPSALALLACRDVVERVSGRRLLAVEAPDTDEAPPLPWSAVEIAAAAAMFADHEIRRGAEATKQRILDDWSSADIVHLSCHGGASISSPLDSALALADGPLTLRAILDRGVGARLAVLSACESGLAGAELPDELVGFPTGLIQTGAGSVIASLWPVRDRGTAMLMFRFYEGWRIEGIEPPEALRCAQLWMRDTSNEQKLDHFQIRLPGSSHPMALAAQAIWRELALDPELELDAHDHAAPYHWAAFQYSGA